MTIMGHDEFARRQAQVAMIHERRANFASERYDYRRLPVDGSLAFNGRRENPAASLVGMLALTIGFALLAYMLTRVIIGH